MPEEENPISNRPFQPSFIPPLTCSAQQPRRTALNSRVPSPSLKAQDEREVYSAVVLHGERGSDSDRSGKPLKTALIPSFPQCGQILSIVRKLFHCVRGKRALRERIDRQIPDKSRPGTRAKRGPKPKSPLFFHCVENFFIAWKNS